MNTVLCDRCPRHCLALRSETAGEGFCVSPAVPHLARAAAHFGEEPCLSGTKGSGAVFFTGCNLRCVFCQNQEISRDGFLGQPTTFPELHEVIRRLTAQGVHNLNFVTATHFSHEIAEYLREYPPELPVIWNSSGYETVTQLRELSGLVSVYLPDFKYADARLATSLSAAPDYPAVALAAVREMIRQVGPPVFDEAGLLQRGVIIRHLILPGYIENTLRVLDLLEDEIPPGSFLLSLLGQYTPISALIRNGQLDAFPSLKRTLLPEEFDRVWQYLCFSSLEDGYVQEPAAAGQEAIPAFDGTGLTFF